MKRLTGGRGGDVVMELVGRMEAVPEDISLTAMMGRYVIIGKINCGLTYEADPSHLVLANKIMIGVSLYRPAVLGEALSFIERTKDRVPYGELLSSKYTLEKIDEAFDGANNHDVTCVSIVL